MQRITSIKASSERISCDQRIEHHPRQTVQVLNNRRQAMLSLGASVMMVASSRPAIATGLESIDMPTMETPDIVQEWQARNKANLDAAEKSFQESDLLKTLKERSEANKDQRKKELAEKYCYRQAELGVGDCAGLRLIPGATQSGVQKRPEWLDKLVYGDNPPDQ